MNVCGCSCATSLWRSKDNLDESSCPFCPSIEYWGLIKSSGGASSAFTGWAISPPQGENLVRWLSSQHWPLLLNRPGKTYWSLLDWKTTLRGMARIRTEIKFGHSYVSHRSNKGGGSEDNWWSEFFPLTMSNSGREAWQQVLSVLNGLAEMVYVIMGERLPMLLNITWHVSSSIPNAHSKIEAIPVV